MNNQMLSPEIIQIKDDIEKLEKLIATYEANHPKKHGETLFLFMPFMIALFIAGVITMKMISPLFGAIAVFVISAIFFVVTGIRGDLKPSWNYKNTVEEGDLKALQSLSPEVKKLISEHMQEFDGRLTFVGLEIVKEQAEEKYKKLLVQLNVQQALYPEKFK